MVIITLGEKVVGLLKGLWTGAKMVLGFSGASKGSDNAMAIAKGVGGFIDEQNFTEQESKEHKLKLAGMMTDFVKSTVGENTARSITRRELAIWIIRVELACLVLYGILASFGLKAADVWWKIAVDSPLGMLTLGVGAFFFGTHLIRAATKQ